jgi:hypothetical protein
MQTILRFATTDIFPAIALTVYNRVVYGLQPSVVRVFGAKNQNVTHLVERYDDVSETPEFQLGYYDNGLFVCVLSGQGDPVPNDKFTCGGVFFNVELYD